MKKQEQMKEYEMLADLLFSYAGSWQGEAAKAHLAEAEELLLLIRETFQAGDAAIAEENSLMEDFLL